MYSINVNGVWRASPKDDYSDGSALASLLGGCLSRPRLDKVENGVMQVTSGLNTLTSLKEAIQFGCRLIRDKVENGVIQITSGPSTSTSTPSSPKVLSPEGRCA